jgi:hypothetical protein
MEKEFVYTFSTPFINVVAHYPDSSTVGASINPIIFLGFSQLINEKEVFKVVNLCYGKIGNENVLISIFRQEFKE